MRRRIVLALLILLLVCGGALAWQLLDWPPPRLVLKYGIPPYCEPTGETMEVEGIEFVEIGPGCFRMGAEYLAEGGDFLGKLCARLGLPWGNQPKPSDEMPVHWVEFENGFWIAKHEVTNEQYERFTPGRERRWFGGGDRHPVVDVSWREAKAFCDRVAAETGLPIRLPSEAEWECACRAGSRTEFCFGDDEEDIGTYGRSWADADHETAEVGTKCPNSWGLHDMHGNAEEWCVDAYHDSYAGAPTDGEPWTNGDRGLMSGSDSWEARVVRGGSFNVGANCCRSSCRGVRLEVNGFKFSGFRVAFKLGMDEARGVAEGTR